MTVEVVVVVVIASVEVAEVAVVWEEVEAWAAAAEEDRDLTRCQAFDSIQRLIIKFYIWTF